MNFYIESVQQICTRFPFKDPVFQKMEFTDPEILKSRNIRSSSDISKLFANLLHVDIETIDNEWLTLRNFGIDFKTAYYDMWIWDIIDILHQ